MRRWEYSADDRRENGLMAIKLGGRGRPQCGQGTYLRPVPQVQSTVPTGVLYIVTTAAS